MGMAEFQNIRRNDQVLQGSTVLTDLQKRYEGLSQCVDAGESGIREEMESVERELKEIQLEAANRTILRTGPSTVKIL